MLITYYHQIFETDPQSLSDFGLDESSKSTVWRQPFPFYVESFPAENNADTIDYDIDSVPKHQHEKYIPSHLPQYPQTHTYVKRLNKKRSANESELQTHVLKRAKPETANMASVTLAIIEKEADHL